MGGTPLEPPEKNIMKIQIPFASTYQPFNISELLLNKIWSSHVYAAQYETISSLLPDNNIMFHLLFLANYKHNIPPSGKTNKLFFKCNPWSSFIQGHQIWALILLTFPIYMSKDSFKHIKQISKIYLFKFVFGGRQIACEL